MTCPYCALFAAQNLPCEACAATITVDKPSRKPKRGKSQSVGNGNGVSWLTKLRDAGMPDDTAICEGLATGAVVQAIGSEADYQHAIDYLESRGFSVAGYRARIVCGSQWIS